MSTIMAAGNVILCIMVAYTQFSILKLHKYTLEKEHRRIRNLIGFMSIFWALIYVYVILADLSILPTMNQTTFGQIFIRPANFFLFGLLAAAGFETLFRYRRYEELFEKDRTDE